MRESKLKSVASENLPKGLYLTLKAVYRGHYLAARRVRRAVGILNRHHQDLQLSVLDIGARHGLGAFGFAELAELKRLHLEGLEPDENEAKLLEERHCYGPYSVVHPVAVSDEPGRVTLYLTDAPGCSSIHLPRSDKLKLYSKASWFELRETIEIETTTLSSLYPEKTDIFDFIKVDVQGAELEVLRGGDRVVRDATAIVLEAHFTELYEGQALFPEIHSYMTERGYRLIMLEEERRVFDGEVVEANCGYVKSMDTITTRDELLKQLLFSTMCGKPAYGKHLLKQVGIDLLSGDDLSRWRRVLGGN